jgi:hypothetical protein
VKAIRNLIGYQLKMSKKGMEDNILRWAFLKKVFWMDVPKHRVHRRALVSTVLNRNNRNRNTDLNVRKCILCHPVSSVST